MGKPLIVCRKAFESEKALAEFLSGRVGDAPVLLCGDLCAVAASGASGRLAEFISENGSAEIAACARRAVEALLAYAGVPEKDIGALAALDVRGNRGCDAEASPPSLPAAASPAEILDAPADAPSWFPVVDRSRCDSCGACVEFCLFGVHAVGGDGKASVVSPGSCKDKCPACARVCPTGAIIFPKFDSAPINGGGSAVSADDGGDGPQGFQLPPEDLHAALAARRRGKGGGKGLFKKPPEGEEGSPR